MKVWQPGCLVADDADEHYEPMDREGRILAAKITLHIRLQLHKAGLKDPVEFPKPHRRTPTQ
jgi:hypothetical protein